MPITSHRVNPNGELIYTISTPELNVVEQQTWKEIKNEPEHIELYQYFYHDDPRLTIERKPINKKFIQSKIQSMILDNITQGNYDAALDLLDNMVASERKPTSLMVLHLFDIILRPQQDNSSVKQLMSMCEKAQRILLYILEVFGTSVFDCIWDMFRMHGTTRLGKRRHVQMLAEFEDEDEEPYECSLTEFDDLWDLTARAIEYVEPRFRSGADRKEPSMDAPGGKLRRQQALDVIISILEADIRSRKESASGITQCMFMNMLRPDSTGRRTQFDRYLDIIFSAFGLHDSKDEDNTSRSQNASNMAILSCCQNAVAAKPLAQQTFRRFTKLDIDGCATLMQVIRSTTFLATLCDMHLSDSDCSKVPEKCKVLRKASIYNVDKLFRFNLWTRPLYLDELNDVYRHVLIIYWRFTTFIHERYMRFEVRSSSDNVVHNKVLTALTDEQRERIIVSSVDAGEKWHNHVEDMIQQVLSMNPEQENAKMLIQQIRQTAKLLVMEWEV
ncbi:hypothetical protein LRAMOSA10409 [Lichtheimia ramosa]|uniref:Uncharacterized protein n=1 Tax=Lichtheimia ramosa TaxID=688394 RepID=A0A077WPL3_9FUNG|nr:hypothetical protein LRAMOSA10409 [Lichtheimia ramosa]